MNSKKKSYVFHFAKQKLYYFKKSGKKDSSQIYRLKFTTQKKSRLIPPRNWYPWQKINPKIASCRSETIVERNRFRTNLTIEKGNYWKLYLSFPPHKRIKRNAQKQTPNIFSKKKHKPQIMYLLSIRNLNATNLQHSQKQRRIQQMIKIKILTDIT